MRVLLVEDDVMIGDSVMEALRRGDHAADWVQDGSSALAALRAGSFDIVLLDLGLPQHDGLSVLRSMRDGADGTPVLIITARDRVADRIRGLDAGADDYLLKPFDVHELAARMRAVVRRREGSATAVLSHRGIRLDPARREATLRGNPLVLTAREWAVLEALMRRPGVVLSRAQIEEKLYGFNSEVTSNAVEVHIHSLRKKLGSDAINNVRSVGWMVPAETLA